MEITYFDRILLQVWSRKLITKYLGPSTRPELDWLRLALFFVIYDATTGIHTSLFKHERLLQF